MHEDNRYKTVLEKKNQQRISINFTQQVIKDDRSPCEGGMQEGINHTPYKINSDREIHLHKVAR